MREPVAANRAVIPPAPGFLQGLRELCSRSGALLIFDEVITGFRLSPGGAAEYFGVQPDLYVFGKIIGGGMPVGAYGGSRALMEHVSPVGPVYQAGTLSGNPVAMAAGLAMLRALKDNRALYRQTEALAARLAAGLRGALPGCCVNQTGSLLCVFFTPGPVERFADTQVCDTARFARYFNFMLERGVYLAPSQFEAMFLSACHTDDDVARTVRAAEEFAASEKRGV